MGVKTVNRIPSQAFFMPSFNADLYTNTPENIAARILKVTEPLNPNWANGALRIVNMGLPQ